jgi:hypothetical protein
MRASGVSDSWQYREKVPLNALTAVEFQYFAPNFVRIRQVTRKGTFLILKSLLSKDRSLALEQ